VPPPARPAGLVARPRLVRRLVEAHDIPLALLVAPAGYGKTTLLAEWADNDPRSFAWMRAGAGTPASALAGLLDVEHMSHPGVLVLDDAHAIGDEDALAVLQHAAETLPAGSQLVVSARGEPGLAVGRLRAHRKLVELRTADLAMDTAEAAALLERVELRLSDHDVDRLVRRTEGWPAGLYLAALSVRAEPDARAAVESFAGDDRLIADYLRDELLAPLDAAQTAFLVRTSVLDTLSAPACDAVLDSGDSAAALADVARSRGVVPPPPPVRGDAARGAPPDGAEAGACPAPARGRVACEAWRGSRRDSPCGGRGRHRYGGGRALVRGRRSHRTG
jgi:ATP/maltotriose-dependent transcriptional regulator MalT